jgi:hypothetical protein
MGLLESWSDCERSQSDWSVKVVEPLSLALQIRHPHHSLLDTLNTIQTETVNDFQCHGFTYESVLEIRTKFPERQGS